MSNDSRSEAPTSDQAAFSIGAVERAKPSRLSLVEATHLLLALCSFAGGLYVLWRVVDDVMFQTFQQGIYLDVWVKLGVAGIAAPSFFWVAFLLLGRSSQLAAERALIAMIEELEVSPATKVELLAEIAVRRSGMGAGTVPNFTTTHQDSVQALAAGQWVLDRFREGAVVTSVPASIATSDKLRSLAGPGDIPIQVLRPGASGGQQ